MKLKNKGKVHPSPSSSSSSSSFTTADNNKNNNDDVFSVLKLLPATILALASILSLEDREVLAYMITRSIKTTTNPNNPSSISQDSTKKSSKKPPRTTTSTAISSASTTTHNHKSPVFDCDCFDCYTSYWFRWDSSPNRELIHQVIEAFEDHLSNGEKQSNAKTTKTKRKDKSGQRKVVSDKQPEMGILVISTKVDHESGQSSSSDFSTNDVVSPVVVVSPEKAADGEENEEIATDVVVPDTAAEKEEILVRSPVGVNNHKGLARKVLPDVLGILNSRLWSLWGPNV